MDEERTRGGTGVGGLKGSGFTLLIDENLLLTFFDRYVAIMLDYFRIKRNPRSLSPTLQYIDIKP